MQGFQRIDVSLGHIVVGALQSASLTVQAFTSPGWVQVGMPPTVAELGVMASGSIVRGSNGLVTQVTIFNPNQYSVAIPASSWGLLWTDIGINNISHLATPEENVHSLSQEPIVNVVLAEPEVSAPTTKSEPEG